VVKRVDCRFYHARYAECAVWYASDGLIRCRNVIELAVYGFLAGILSGLLPPKRLSVYIAMILAMLAGRLILGGVFIFLTGIQK